MDDLRHLATLLAQRNGLDSAISAIIHRPATSGHLGEFIAAQVFNIELEASASHKSSDGHFREGSLAGRSVDVKFYGKQEGLLAVQEGAQPDYFLVLSEPEAAPSASRGHTQPSLIEHVYLFRGEDLAADIRKRGVKFGVAASIPRANWLAAEVFPTPANPELVLTQEQRQLLALFSSKAGA